MASTSQARDASKFGLAELRNAAFRLTGQLSLELNPARSDEWIGLDELCDPLSGPSAALHERFSAAGFGSSRRASSASLLLRYGWAAGFQIATWLEHKLVLHLDRFAIKFSQSTLVEGVWVQSARLDEPSSETEGRILLLQSLLNFTDPIIVSQHHWSRFSRHALWSMAVSSWAAQFAAIGERLGRRDEAIEDARHTFALHPEIERAAPEIYVVRAGSSSRVCQKRSACCLYFKGPAEHFCVSCPILPSADRLARNRDFSCPTG